MFHRYRPLWPYLQRYRAHYTIGALCVFGSAALRLSIPHLLGDSLDAIDRLGRPTDGAVDRAALSEAILTSALLIVGAALAGAFVRTQSRLSLLGNSRRAVHDVRGDLFDKLLKLPPSFYVRHQLGHIMSRCVNDMQNVQGLLGPVFMYLVETFVLYAVGLFFLLQVDPVLAAVGLAPFPLFLWWARRLAGHIQRDSRAAQEKLGEIAAKVDESLSGQRVIKSLALEGFDADRFASRCEDYRQTMIRVARSRATLQPAMVLLAALCTFLVLAVGGPMVAAGSLTVGELVETIFYLGILAVPTGTLGFVISSLQRGAAALERVAELLEMPIALSDDGDGPAPADVGAVEVRGLTVEFAPPRDQPHLGGSLSEEALAIDRARRVLDDVSVSVAPGTTLGVVGPTGGGKTTLLRALARQLEVERGTVFLGGVDVSDLPLSVARRAVGFVPQETFLFSAPLRDNIAFGRPDASGEAIARATEIAGLDQDLAQLTDGLDTLVGERGVKLSGGQRQRAALARVVLLEPRILLLDDALSAVDADTAARILAALRPVFAGRTVVIVAHRLELVEEADEIIVIEAGRLTERGTHAELMDRGGWYAATYRQQSEQGDSP